MGKVVKYTGSKLLGEELRRLRGARSLDDIVELSKQSPLTSRIHPVSAPTLSQIENGITMPSTEVLYTLSVLYNVSPSRLLHHIVEERLAKTGELPETREETRDRLNAELTSGNWYEALALAIHGGALASTEGQRLLWQASRAYAMRRLGLRQDAVILLLECISSTDLPPDHRYMAHMYLADVLAECGYFDPAAHQALRAWEALPGTASPGLRARVLRSRISLVLADQGDGRSGDESLLLQVGKWIDEVETLEQPTGEAALALTLYRAIVHERRGNKLVAALEYTRVADEAARIGAKRLEISALGNLGVLRRGQGRLSDARKVLNRAESIALELQRFDDLFNLYFDLFLVSEAAGDHRGPYLLKRCLRFWPLVHARTPALVHFERLLREGRVR